MYTSNNRHSITGRFHREKSKNPEAKTETVPKTQAQTQTTQIQNIQENVNEITLIRTLTQEVHTQRLRLSACTSVTASMPVFVSVSLSVSVFLPQNETLSSPLMNLSCGRGGHFHLSLSHLSLKMISFICHYSVYL